MAMVNVAEWNAFHVGDWLRGLDDSILPYVQFFVNNHINGCRLLLMTANDLDRLNIRKVGHQEIILEAIELLRQLHYNFCSETLQTIALRLACKSRSLFNQLRHLAAAAAAVAAAEAAAASNAAGTTGNDTSNHHHHHRNTSGSSNSANASSSGNSKGLKQVDLSPVSTATLASVSEILGAVKDFISWIDRYPFDGQESYIEARKNILQLSVELASTAQRDKFVQGPNEVIRTSCKKLADICDRLVQELTDSLAMQSASLEVVIVSKKLDEELGMHIHSSYSGVHVVGGLKHHSPAYLNGNIEEGDEIVQVNYQTVVGWQLKKLVASMRQFPIKIILTVKKRPRHFGTSNFTLLSPFSLPIPDFSILTSQLGQQSQQSHSQHHQNYPINIPPPQQPIPFANQATYQEYSVINSTSDPQMLYSPIPSMSQQYSVSACSSALPLQPPQSTAAQHQQQQQQPPTPPLKRGGLVSGTPTANGLQHKNSSSSNGPINTSSATAPVPAIKPNRNTLKKTLNKLACVGVGKSVHKSSDHNQGSGGSSQSRKSIPDSGGQTKPGSSKLSQTIITRSQANQPQSVSGSKKKSKTMLLGTPTTSKKGIESKLKNRVATTRCSSASDSSPFSLSDSTSTLFTSSDDCQDEDEKCQDHSGRSRGRGSSICNRFHGNKKPLGRNNAASSGGCGCRPRPMVDPDSGSRKDSSSGRQHEEEEYSDAALQSYDNDDNDSAFYSGRTTSANDINQSATSHDQGIRDLPAEEEVRELKQVENTILNSLARVSLRESGMIPGTDPLYDVDYRLRRQDLDDEDKDNDQQETKKGSRANNKKNSKNTTSVPRTSAEFEALYQQKKNSLDSIGGTVHSSSGASCGGGGGSSSGASNCSGSNSGCEGGNSNHNQPHYKSASTRQLTPVQLTTISHLTHLAKNIRFANTAPVMSNVTTATTTTTGSQSTLTSSAVLSHSKTSPSASDTALISRINQSLNRLTNGNLVMGNHEDHLLIYKSGNGNSLPGISPTTTTTTERLPFNTSTTTSGSLLTVDRSNPAHWTRIRAVLSDNCLNIYSDSSSPSTACVELPVHLPGYYILINKDDLLNSEESGSPESLTSSDSLKPELIEQYYQFTLVTYHRLFTFAVDQAAKLARWIARFGYRYCCNPKQSQLCFNYYLSPVHVSGIGIGKRPSLGSPAPTGQSAAAITASSSDSDKQSNQPIGDEGSSSSARNQIESEFESDDYHELLMMSSASSLSNVEDPSVGPFHQNNVVKFGENGVNGDNNGTATTESEFSESDSRRFPKSPHPRGSARFAVRPRANEEQFIDSVNVGNKSSGSMMAAVNSLAATALLVAAAPIGPDLDYDFPQNKSQAKSISNSTDSQVSHQDSLNKTNTTSSDLAAPSLPNLSAPSPTSQCKSQQQQQPIIMSQQPSKYKSPTPPELPPRGSAQSAAISANSCSGPVPASLCPSLTLDSSVPRPRPRISKMSVSGSSVETSPINTSTNSTPNGTRTSQSKAKQSSVGPSGSNSLRMAPIPVPEKSAAISQTIQHFANLQRQNNLRRSFAGQNAGSSGAINELAIAAASAVASLSQKKNFANGDYDYIGTTTTAAAASGHTQQTSLAKRPDSIVKSAFNNGVGNPIYCHLPRPPLNQPDCNNKPEQESSPDTEDSEASVITVVPSGSGSVLDREYCRLYGYRKPPTLADKPTADQDNSQPEVDDPSQPAGASLSEEDDQTLTLPPPQLPPPQPPPIIRNCLLKGQQSSDCEELDCPTGTTSSSFAKHVASPKMVKRNSNNNKNRNQIANSEAKADLAADPVHPDVSDHCQPLSAPAVPAKPPPPLSPLDCSPPTLLPRRSATGPQKTPPPLPTTSHPLLAKASSVPQSSQADSSDKSAGTMQTGPSTDGSSPINAKLTGSKQLNRSFSDAHRQKPSRARPRKSLEGGTGLSRNRLDESEEGSVFQDSGSLLLSQQKQQNSQQNNPDLSNSNRSLPTMGVSMLGKKRLSNVSADSHAIEKAITLFERDQLPRRPSTGSNAGSEIRTDLDDRNNNNPGENEATWGMIEKTLSDTKQRLLNH